MRYTRNETLRPPPADLDIPECPVAFARERLEFEPDPHQEQILRSAARFGILNCSRQWGKSTVLAILALHTALRHRGSLILLLGSVHRQSLELLDKIGVFADRLDIRLRGGHQRGVVLPNQSRLVPLPAGGERLRGFSAVKLIIIDEAAQVPDSVYRMLRPMLLASRGSLWLASTPFGRRGFFYSEWTSDADWARFTVRATDCPRFAPEDLERERKVLTGRYFDQEFNCAFVDPHDALFPLDLIERATVDDEPLDLR